MAFRLGVHKSVKYGLLTSLLFDSAMTIQVCVRLLSAYVLSKS